MKIVFNCFSNLSLVVTSFLLIVLSLSSCSKGFYKGVDSSLETEKAQNFNIGTMNQIGIMPLRNGSYTGDFSTNTMNILTRDLSNALNSYTSIELIVLKDDSSLQISQKELALKLGKSRNLQGVLFGEVLNYDGNDSYKNKDTDKSVGFQLKLLDVEGQRIVWKGQFEKANVPLSENISSFKRYANEGFAFKSPLERLRLGFKLVSKDIESERLEALNLK